MKSMKLITASKNPKKIKELNRILQPLGIQAVHEDDCGICLPEVVEDGETFLENAKKKAVSAMQATGLPAIADDSGLCVAALDGAPGVYSARFSGENATDEQNNQKLLKLLENVPEEKRDAYFISVICVVFPNGDILSAEGRVDGKIAFEPSGSGGFGYDPLFVVDGKSFGEMTAQQKDAISHRGRALRQIAVKLEEYLHADK